MIPRKSVVALIGISDEGTINSKNLVIIVVVDIIVNIRRRAMLVELRIFKRSYTYI